MTMFNAGLNAGLDAKKQLAPLPKKRLLNARLGALLAALLIAGSAPLAAEIIHREKSLYRNIIIRESAGKRCLAFSVRRKERNQTCINLRRPKKVVFPYVRMTFAGLLVNPNPQKMLMIGLGGGTIPGILAEVYPDMAQDLVEIDPAVIKMARRYFNFMPEQLASDERDIRVHTQDGRVFTRRALKAGYQYDLIILDAFTGDYIPEHLMTQEFLMELKTLLTPETGVVVANTFSRSKLYDHESVTWRSVFGTFFNFKMSGTGNRVIVAANGDLPDDDTLRAHAARLAKRLAPYSIRLESFPRRLSRKQDWNASRRVLTDQYSPANLLQDWQPETDD